MSVAIEKLDAAIRDALARALRPRPKLPPWQWAEENVELGKRESIEHSGPYRSDLTPYNRQLMQWAVDRGVDELFITKSSQSGVTLSMLLVILHKMATDPANLIYCINSTDEARKISKVRLQPMFADCPAVAQEISEDEEQSNLTMYLRDAIIYLIGAYGAGALANKTAALVILDELDKHPSLIEGEGSTVKLARARLKAVADSKLIGFSTPTTEAGQVWQEFKRGSQHKFFVPCPICNLPQTLEWDRVRFGHCKDLAGEWDLKRVRRETYYQCEAGCRIEESHKRAMVLAGEWRATNPKAPEGVISAQISDLYSQFEKARWGRLAEEWIAAQGNPADIETFFRDRLGTAPKGVTGDITEEMVLACRSAYRRGSCPIDPEILIAACDVQADVKKWALGAFNAKGDLYVCDYGATLTFDDLNDAARAVIHCKSGAREAQLGIIDEGYRATEVREFCLDHLPFWWPCKGRGGLAVRHTVASTVSNTKSGADILVYHFDDDGFKRMLYLGRIKQRKKQLDYGHPVVYLPEDCDPEFIAELHAERLVEKADHRGVKKYEWHKPERLANDYGDVLKMLLVAWSIVQPEVQAQAVKAGRLTQPAVREYEIRG